MEQLGRRWLPPVALALAAIVVFGGALSYYFAQDDFFALARSSGLLPRLQEPWRYLSAQAYFDLMHLLGAGATAYHWVSLGGHLACALLLYGILRRAFAPSAAILAAVFFAVHPMLFTLLYSISGIADIFALFFALLTLQLGRRADSWRWTAVGIYAAALLCKESVLFLPAVLALFLAWDRRPQPPAGTKRPGPQPHSLWAAVRDPLVLVLIALGTAYAIYFFAARPMAYAILGTGSQAYALGLGAHLWQNGLTYLGWTVNFLYPTVRGFTDAVDPRVFPYAFLGLALWGAGALVPALRRRGWFLGGAVFVLLLLPVLPLRNHTYHYYLYGALVGAAWCVAALWDALLAPRATTTQGNARRNRTIATALVIAVLFANGFALVRKIETQPFTHPELRAEPVVDRARIAAQVRDGLRAFDWPDGARLLFWSPEARSLSAARNPSGQPSERETYWEQNVRTAIADGLAVRLLHPEIHETEFVLDFGPVGDRIFYAIYRVNGELEVMGSKELEALLLERLSTAP